MKHISPHNIYEAYWEALDYGYSSDLEDICYSDYQWAFNFSIDVRGANLLKYINLFHAIDDFDLLYWIKYLIEEGVNLNYLLDALRNSNINYETKSEAIFYAEKLLIENVLK